MSSSHSVASFMLPARPAREAARTAHAGPDRLAAARGIMAGLAVSVVAWGGLAFAAVRYFGV